MVKITWKEALYGTINDWTVKFLFLASIISIIVGIFENNLLESFTTLITSAILFFIAVCSYKHMSLDNPKNKKIVEYCKRCELEALVLGQISKGEKLSEEVLKKLVETFAISEVKGDCHKYTQTVMTTIKIQKHSFVITWQKGLYNEAHSKYNFQPVKID